MVWEKEHNHIIWTGSTIELGIRKTIAQLVVLNATL
jgi:hypothetical protein